MASDVDFERRLQALLDGDALEDPSSRIGDMATADALHVVSDVARIHRIALFGSDKPIDRGVVTEWGHLEIRGEIGRGAHGTVYRAWDSRLAREVALKLFAPDEDPAQALAEGRLLARLDHPNIVRVFGADTHDGRAGIWMELLEGESLDELLARAGVFSAEETLLIGIDLAGALAAVHAASLLHRDIKARNVLRERDGRIVLMDLGAGRTVDERSSHGDAAGTPMYMAPEVLRGDTATPQSDLYCLGVLLYRLLTGDYPVTADTVEQLREAHAAGRRTPLMWRRGDISETAAAAIERCAAPRPEDRPATAAEAEAEFGRALGATLAGRRAIRTPLQRFLTRSRRVVVMAGAAAAVLALTTWSVWDSGPTRAVRRRAGLTVAPRSPLYFSLNGGLGILRQNTATLHAYAPGVASVIAVSSEMGVRAMSGMPPWTPTRGFNLDGVPLPAAPTRIEGLCCFSDGTTDGRFNYAARTDSTLLDQRGSRPLAPPGLYRFGRDWSSPEMLFALQPLDTGYYSGVAYSGRSRTFWLLRNERGDSVLENWSGDGRLLSTIRRPSQSLGGLAIDPADGTLWSRRIEEGVDLSLENFDPEGRHLGSHAVPGIPDNPLAASSGLEFAWTQTQGR